MLTIEAAQQILDMIPSVQRSGICVEAIDRGYVRMRMPIEGNTNHMGSMYAGAQFILAEIPGGLIVASSFNLAQFYPVIKSVNIQFRKPAIGELTVEVRMTPEEIDRVTTSAEANGKADFSWICELKNSANEIVALSENLYQLRAHKF